MDYCSKIINSFVLGKIFLQNILKLIFKQVKNLNWKFTEFCNNLALVTFCIMHLKIPFIYGTPIIYLSNMSLNNSKENQLIIKALFMAPFELVIENINKRL
jgi:hypothetical protein